MSIALTLPQEAPEPIWDAERDRAAAMTGTFTLTFPGQPVVRGRVVSQAKGPNRAADRARGIYGKRGKR